MIILFTIIHVLICFFLILVVLLQSGKAADLAGAFGGMGSQTAFGPRGAASLLSRATTTAATLFMITSLILAIMATRGAGVGTSVLERQPAAATETAPTSGTEGSSTTLQFPGAVPAGEGQTAPAGQPAETPATPPQN